MKNRIKERLWLCAALAALLLAAGCGAQESGGSHLESDDAAPAQTVSVGQGDAAIALSLPAGWEYRAEEEPSAEGLGYDCALVFWPEDTPACAVTVFARQEAIGLCGTGLTIEPRAWESGLEATAYSERLGGEEGDHFWYLLIYNDTPSAAPRSTAAQRRCGRNTAQRSRRSWAQPASAAGRNCESAPAGKGNIPFRRVFL